MAPLSVLSQEQKKDNDILIDLKQTNKVKEEEDILFVQEDNIVVKEDNTLKDIFSIYLQSKNYEKISKLLSEGYDINHILYNGNNAVNISSFHKDSKYLIFLAKNGAKLNHINNNGESIFYWGATSKNTEYLNTIKNIMLKKDFNNLIIKKDKNGRSILHSSVLYDGDISVLEWILDNKIYINEKDIEGKTALHYAINIRNWKALIFLISKGGDLTIKDNNNSTVEDRILENFDLIETTKLYPYLSKNLIFKINQHNNLNILDNTK